ncbi:MAG: SprB repeat-containing protein, partial [Flavobacteriales bacterium]
SSSGTTLNASATGGAGGYTYTWYNGSTVISTTDSYFATAPGNFKVIVQDALFRSCPSDTVDVPVALANIAIATTSTNASCFNFNNGTATADVTGGTPPFSYEWTSGATVVSNSQTATNLGVGTYSVTVTDAGGCANTSSVTITDPPALTITPQVITNVGCNGESTGGIQVDVNGGTLPYQFSWSNGETTEDLINIPAGNYTLTVTDTQGCVQSFNQLVDQPTQIDSLISGTTLTVVNVSCYGGTDGSVSISVSGGTPPYNFFWSDGSFDSLLVNQPAGPVEVLVRDANGCSSTTAITITEPDELIANIQSVSLYQGAYNVTCNGATDGSIDLEISGGTPVYSYSWSNGDLNQDLTGIGAGTYDVLVTDANGC